jgi:hypothetical protein
MFILAPAPAPASASAPVPGPVNLYDLGLTAAKRSII